MIVWVRICLSCVLVLGGTLGFIFLDDQSVVDAIYCSCITLSTVGYGDICPNKKTWQMKLFVVCLAISGLEVFCGHFLNITSTWTDLLSRGSSISNEIHATFVLFVVMGASAVVFTTLEEWDYADAVYFAVITGTTIGYGDHPQFKTDYGKLAAAAFAIFSINAIGFVTSVIGGMLTEFLKNRGDDKLIERGADEIHRGKLLLLVAVLLICGVVGFMSLDDQSFVDAIYCSCITLSTVGYGDVCPKTKSVEMKLFVAIFALIGLGVFCGPFLDLMAEWKRFCGTSRFPCLLMFVTMSLLSLILFTTIEAWDVSESLYFAVITGTTIGYGDHPPFKTQHGKLAAAIFALLSINVVGLIVSTFEASLSSILEGTLVKVKQKVRYRWWAVIFSFLVLFCSTVAYRYTWSSDSVSTIDTHEFDI